MAKKGGVEITVINKAGFTARMGKRIAGLEIQGRRLEEQTAKEIAEVAKTLVAVDTGKTQENIRAEDRGQNWAVVSDRGGDRPEVAVILEYGSVYQAAQPYLIPAAQIVLAARGMDGALRGIGGLLVT